MNTKTWFTADTHFGHANIIHFCHRPFKNVDEMDRILIENWNKTVGPDDDIWHLGDFAMSRLAHGHYLEKLNGRKHFIWGNHDRSDVKKSRHWTTSQPYSEIQLDGVNICLFHYGMRVWNRSHHGALHFYGHSHGTLPGDGGSLDVGVDVWNFTPVGLADIQARLKTLPPREIIDHHGRE